MKEENSEQNIFIFIDMGSSKIMNKSGPIFISEHL